MQEIHTKVLIVGAGPIGLFSVFMLGMMQLRCCVLDALPVLGGQCQVLYPDKPIYDIPGFPSIQAGALIQALKTQINPFDAHFFLEEKAETAVRENDLWHVSTSRGRVFHTHSIILCCGSGLFVPRRPPLPNIEPFEGQSVFYYVPDVERFLGKDVVIAGGGDSAVDWALMLAPLTKSLHMVHRRAQFRAQDHTLAQLKSLQDSGKLTLHVPFQLSKLYGEGKQLSHVEISDFSGNITTLKADFLLPFFGLESNIGPLKTWGLFTEKDHFCTDPLTGQTNLPGIYAAGDSASYPHKLKLILTGFSEVAQIAHHIKRMLFPERAASFQHSTTSGIPKALV
jgi:thioredoxin reductase (NADPH)